MNNQYRVSGKDCIMTIHSKKYGSKEMIFDVEDLELASLYTWALSLTKQGNFYAVTHDKASNYRLLPFHRLVTQEKFPIVDHKDRNTLNNKKENLREATASQNSFNSRTPTNNLLKIKGVCFLKNTGKYRAAISDNGKRIYLGSYSTAEEASMVYQAALKDIAKDFAPTINEVKYA